MEVKERNEPMNDFQGVFPAIITPMTAQDELSEEAFRKVMEFNIEAGVHGFWVAGGTGESVMLDDAENNRLADIAADQAGGRVKIIMHVGAPTTKRAVQMAEHAAKAGVEAICCVPPFFYRQSDEAMVEHYRTVAAAADLPLFVYNLPISTGVEITPELMLKIKETVPQLAGLKHSALTFSNVRQFISMGLSCFIGNCRLMLPALVMGAAGCIDGWPNLAPELWVEIWQAFREGNLERALAVQDRGIEVSNLGNLGQFHSVLKAGLSERLGLDCGNPRPPGEPLPREAREQLRQRLAHLGLLGKR